MINYQNINAAPPTNPVEIDKAIYELQVVLSLNLNWLTHAYARCYRHIEKTSKKLYLPEVYIGGEKRSYVPVTPDNDKKGLVFFVVGKEKDEDFEQYKSNFIKWETGIIFWANMHLIDPALLDNMNFTQNLIRDAREVLTKKLGGLSFGLRIKNIETEFKEIFREFTLDETNEYLRAPYTGFRVNCEITLQEQCGDMMYDRCDAISKNISNQEMIDCVVPSIEWTGETFNAMSQEQKDALTVLMGGTSLNSSGTRIPNTIPINPNGTQVAWLNKDAGSSTGLGYIRKDALTSGFDSGAVFSISTLNDYKVEFKFEDGIDAVAGISYTDSGYNLEDIEFGWFITGGVAVEVIENGNIKAGTLTAVNAGDTLQIRKNGFMIQYYVNNVLKSTSYLLYSNNEAHGFMMFDCSIKTSGKAITDLFLTYL